MEDGRVFLACVGEVKQPVSVQIRSKDGAPLLYQSTHSLPRSGGTMGLNLPALPGGCYSVLVRCGNFSETRALIVSPTKKKKTWTTFFSQRFWRRGLWS
ncbi:MAG: hypothetical protein HY842_11065 [Bacteroidetes bacterium]|nr:hypothetical protein [Bacteroidota bacterium]